jgi:hypothetical protein
MSYIRAGHPMGFVDGMSYDYVYPTFDGEHKYIEDYGSITNEGIIEMIYQHWETPDEYDALLKDKLLRYLAERLHVKIRSDAEVKR